MKYTLAGQFLEACDCTVICPCWVDDDPVGGHCTGFILWDFQKDKDNNNRDSTIIDEGGSKHIVTGCKVVSVATHSGKRRGSAAPTTSVVYIDASQCADAHADPQKLFDVLNHAFAARPEDPAKLGPLAELAEVSGTIVGVEPADISFRTQGDSWTATVTRPGAVQGQAGDAAKEVFLIEATGYPSRFDEKELRNPRPLELSNTALSYELQAQNPVAAQVGERLVVNVGALPGGSLEVTGRSGMRGTFSYSHPAPRKNPAAARPANALRKLLP